MKTSRSGLQAPLIAVFAIVALLLAGCSSSTSNSGSGSGQTITLYNAQHEQTTAKLIAASAEAYT